MTSSDPAKRPGGKWLMIAPGHDNLDHRVNRTIAAICANDHDLTVFYEADRLVPGRAMRPDITIEKTPGISKAYFKQIWQALRVHKGQHEQLTIYVHDSGFIGLLICLMASVLKRKTDQIIFDYHDLLEWELYFQSARVTQSKPMKKVLVTATKLFFRFVLRWAIRLDLIVGISQGQVDLLQQRFGIGARQTHCVPNTRKKLEGDFQRSGPSAILWVGNVSKGRQFERTYPLQQGVSAKSPETDPKIVIVGKRLNAAADDVVDDRLVSELGGFKSDQDIVDLTTDMETVGVFFGWEDEYHTGINAISSVNKVYSYINTGTPFLIPKTQTNMIETLGIPSVFVFETDADLIERFIWIAQNYRQAQDLVFDLKDGVSWDAEVSAGLEKEFAR